MGKLVAGKTRRQETLRSGAQVDWEYLETYKQTYQLLVRRNDGTNTEVGEGTVDHCGSWIWGAVGRQTKRAKAMVTVPREPQWSAAERTMFGHIRNLVIAAYDAREADDDGADEEDCPPSRFEQQETVGGTHTAQAAYATLCGIRTSRATGAPTPQPADGPKWTSTPRKQAGSTSQSAW